jgi:hypothetical protein
MYKQQRLPILTCRRKIAKYNCLFQIHQVVHTCARELLPTYIFTQHGIEITVTNKTKSLTNYTR